MKNKCVFATNDTIKKVKRTHTAKYSQIMYLIRDKKNPVLKWVKHLNKHPSEEHKWPMSAQKDTQHH